MTHDPAVARRERIIEIRDGEIIADSRPAPQENAQAVGAGRRGGFPAAGGRPFPRGAGDGPRAMAANKMRTALTMLGIIIGIASVVSIR